MWIVFNSSITFTPWHERRSRSLNKLFACVCVCKCECVCASSISIWQRRKGEQGQTGGWACNGQRKWKARGRMTKPCSFSSFLSTPSTHCILELSSRTFRRVGKGVALSPQQIYRHNQIFVVVNESRGKYLFDLLGHQWEMN